jgi:hypothetical protein
MTFPRCDKCPLSNYGRDCQNNPNGYRDLLIGAAKARKIEELRIGQKEFGVIE